MNSENSEQDTIEAEAKNVFVVTMLRATGAFFVLLGLLVFLDIGGFVSTMLKDTFITKVLGCAFCCVGLLDIFIAPILVKTIAKQQAEKK